MSNATFPQTATPRVPQDGVVDTVIADVTAVRRALSWVFYARVVAQALGAALAAWLVLSLTASYSASQGMPSLSPTTAMLSGALVAVLSALFIARGYGRITLLRAALWIEEHGGTGFALVTWVEQSLGGSAMSSSLAGAVSRASAGALSRAREALPRLARAQLTGPLLFVVGVVAVAVIAPRARDAALGASTAASANASSTEARRDLPIGAWSVRVTPPAYTGQAAKELGDVTSARVLSGTRIDIVGEDATPDSIRVRSLADSVSGAPIAPRATLERQSRGWTSRLIATDAPLEVRVARAAHAKLLLLEGVGDSIPRAMLRLPARDSVLRKPEGKLTLDAVLHDDLGLARASFEVVISSGEGERFTVRTVTVGARSFAGDHDVTLRAELDVTALQLGPGDVVHMRALARDAHPLSSREAGASDTRSFRVARASEYDSVAVEPAPPPEVDKSLLSQRMLLLLTEKLEARRPRISRDVLREESRILARDQGRLRQAVGDAVFQRLTGDAGGEHSHSADDGHDHGVEAVGGKLALSGVNAQGMLEEGDDAPVIAINKPLLEAYNAMWDAGRALEQSEPRAAIPFMRIALAAIERARAASRLYLRGKPPTVIIDLAKVRLSGKDTGAVNTRIARTALPTKSTVRESRLLAAASLVSTNAEAARDSLAVLRLESLADAPTFAQALASLLAAMGSSTSRANPTDVTDAFLRARRVLGGVERVSTATWSRGGPP